MPPGPNFPDCPQGYTRDFFLLLPTAETLLTAPCDLPETAFVVLCVIWAVVNAAFSLVTLVGACLAKVRAARIQLLLCSTHAVPLVVLFAGAASNDYFWAGEPLVFILWGFWASSLFTHILTNVHQLKVLTSKLIPETVGTPGGRNYDPGNRTFSRYESSAIFLSMVFVVLCGVFWCILVPVTDYGTSANLYLDPQGRASKQLFWALGCWCHPIVAMLFISLPINYLARLIRSIKAARSLLAQQQSSPPGLERSDDPIKVLEAKFWFGAVQAIVSALLAQSIWIIVSDSRIVGCRWYFAFILTLIGNGFHLSLCLYYLPIKAFRKFQTGANSSSAVPKAGSRSGTGRDDNNASSTAEVVPKQQVDN